LSDALTSLVIRADGFLVSADRFDGHVQLMLRLTPSLNNQTAGINWADDFDFEARLVSLRGP
jgi:hypothetical protein